MRPQILHLNFPSKNQNCSVSYIWNSRQKIWRHTHATPKTNGHPSGENFGVGWKFWFQAKILGSDENFGFRRKILVRMKILVWGENFGFGRKFLVRVKILVLGENFGFGWKYLVRAKILGLGEIFWFGGKFWNSHQKKISQKMWTHIRHTLHATRHTPHPKPMAILYVHVRVWTERYSVGPRYSIVVE